MRVTKDHILTSCGILLLTLVMAFWYRMGILDWSLWNSNFIDKAVIGNGWLALIVLFPFSFLSLLFVSFNEFINFFGWFGVGFWSLIILVIAPSALVGSFMVSLVGKND